MNLIRFSSLSPSPVFGDMDRWFEQVIEPRRSSSNGPRFMARVDVEEDDKTIVLKADLPGMEEKDIELRVEDGVLTLQGERKIEKETKEENLQRVERSYGSFVRRFTLPESVDADKIGAGFSNGVLKITMPKTAAALPKVIKIR